ncbi:MAG: M56 family metallopeptidase [Oscillospiraceae bacterium]|nr:M56 family metallopeptidase [Oscillospiraceae bacterium]
MLTIFKLIVISSAVTSIIFAVMKLAEKILIRGNNMFAKALVLTFSLLCQPSVVLLTLFCREVKPANLEKQGSIISTSIEILDTSAVNSTINKMEYIAHKINVLQILAYIWLFTAAVFILLNLFKYFKFKNTLKKSFIREIDNNISELRIFSSGIVSSPFLIGVFKPVIVVPEMEFSESELSMTVRHETVHLRRHDIIKKLVMNFLRCVNWFNPVFYVIEKQAGEMSEFIADETLTANASYSERKEYGNLLLKFAENEAYAAGMYSRLSGNALRLAKRLELVMNNSPRKKLNKATVITGTIAAIAVIGISVNAMVDMVPKDTANDTISPDKIVEAVPVGQQPVEGFTLLESIGKRLPTDSFEFEPQKFFPTLNMYAVKTTESYNSYSVQDIAYSNGQVIVLGNNEGGFYFEKGQSGSIKISANLSPEYSNIDGKGELLEIGYIYDGSLIELYSGKIGDNELSISFEADNDGDYQFYICNACAGLQNYNYILIEKQV